MSPALLFLPLGFLHVFLYEAGGSSLLGHLDVSKPAPFWNTLTLNLPRSAQTIDEKYMTVLGTSGVSFTVEVTQCPLEILLNTPQNFNVTMGKVNVFQFNPPKGISKAQLDITATSQSNVPAYLKVSQVYQDVQENIKVVDYKKESLRLSFARKGRITLSKASVPPLKDSTSSWYVGIALKDATGSLKSSESKSVTLKLSQSFDYSYAGPICFIFFVSLVVGVIVSACALCLFQESLNVTNTPDTTVIAKVSNELQDLPPGNHGNNDPPGNQGNNNRQDSNKCKRCKMFGKFILAMIEVARHYWFSGGPKTYSYITGIAGFVLLIGAGQYVIENWYIMIQEGDRDSCYYNDFCYRVSGYDIPFNLMISNLGYIIHALILTVSVWYMETKLYLYCENLKDSPARGTLDEQKDILPDHVIVCHDTTPHLLDGVVPKHTFKDGEKKVLMAKALKRRYSYSIGYAFAWALLFEGMFSTIYHLCPSRYTFQFDSAFMFVIAGLIVLLLYNGIELNECPKSDRVKYPIGALNFFLFFIVPLFIFNYFGSLYNSKSGLNKVLKWFFFGFLFLWWIAMLWWAFCKLQGVFPTKFKSLIKDYCCFCCRCTEVPQENSGENYWNVGYFVMGGLVAPLLLFLLHFLSDLSQAFLFTCIAVSVFALCAKTKMIQKLCALCYKCYEWSCCKCRKCCECSKCCGCCECERSCSCQNCSPADEQTNEGSEEQTNEGSAVTAKRKRVFGQVCYIVLTAGVLAGAVFIFIALPTTDKTSSPEESRNKNKECEMFGFFDWHDIWHFSSSFALLMGAFVVMFISAESVQSNVKSGKVCADTARENETEMNENESQGGDERFITAESVQSNVKSGRVCADTARENETEMNENESQGGDERFITAESVQSNVKSGRVCADTARENETEMNENESQGGDERFITAESVQSNVKSGRVCADTARENETEMNENESQGGDERFITAESVQSNVKSGRVCADTARENETEMNENESQGGDERFITAESVQSNVKSGRVCADTARENETEMNENESQGGDERFITAESVQSNVKSGRVCADTARENEIEMNENESQGGDERFITAESVQSNVKSGRVCADTARENETEMNENESQGGDERFITAESVQSNVKSGRVCADTARENEIEMNENESQGGDERFITAESVQSNVNSERVCADTARENEIEINENESQGGDKRGGEQ